MIKGYLKAIIIDDEQSAIKNLTVILNDFCSQIDIIGNATNVDDGLELINKTQPNIIFLDIEMPGKSGFELLKEIDTEEIQIVFITAYNEYAVKAFEVSAADYLLKPISIKRLIKTVEKLQKNKKINTLQIKAVKENLQKSSLQKLILPYKNRHIVIKINNIICFEAEGAYSKVYYLENNILTIRIFSKTLRSFEELIDNNSFFRSHRSWLVSKKHIINYDKSTKKILLKNNINAPLSRNNIKLFTNWLHNF